jgi:hypothetical protein
MAIAAHTPTPTAGAADAYAGPSASEGASYDQHPDPAPELLDFDALWQRYRISRTRAYKLLGAGELRAIKVGFRTLIPTASVREFLARQPAARIRQPAAPQQAA